MPHDGAAGVLPSADLMFLQAKRTRTGGGGGPGGGGSSGGSGGGSGGGHRVWLGARRAARARARCTARITSRRHHPMLVPGAATSASTPSPRVQSSGRRPA